MSSGAELPKRRKSVTTGNNPLSLHHPRSHEYQSTWSSLCEHFQSFLHGKKPFLCDGPLQQEVSSCPALLTAAPKHKGDFSYAAELVHPCLCCHISSILSEKQRWLIIYLHQPHVAIPQHVTVFILCLRGSWPPLSLESGSDGNKLESTYSGSRETFAVTARRSWSPVGTQDSSAHLSAVPQESHPGLCMEIQSRVSPEGPHTLSQSDKVLSRARSLLMPSCPADP